MSDDNSHSSDTISNKKGFFSLLLSQLFHGEPKNRDELLALIRDSNLHTDLIILVVPNKHVKKSIKKVIALIRKMMK